MFRRRILPKRNKIFLGELLSKVYVHVKSYIDNITNILDTKVYVHVKSYIDNITNILDTKVYVHVKSYIDNITNILDTKVYVPVKVVAIGADDDIHVFYCNCGLINWNPVNVVNSGLPLIWIASSPIDATFYSNYPFIDTRINTDRITFKIKITSEDSLDGLTRLEMQDTYLVYKVPDLSIIPNLEYIDLSRNNFPEGFKDLKLLPNLKVLKCYRSEIVASFISLIQTPKLETLLLYDNHISSNVPYLPPLLKEVNISNNQLTGYLPDCSQLHNLVTLNVSGNNLNGITSFSSQLTVTDFDFRNNGFTVEETDEVLRILNLSLGYGSGKILIAPGTNSKPSTVGLGYRSQLVLKGWTVVT